MKYFKKYILASLILQFCTAQCMLDSTTPATDTEPNWTSYSNDNDNSYNDAQYSPSLYDASNNGSSHYDSTYTDYAPNPDQNINAISTPLPTPFSTAPSQAPQTSPTPSSSSSFSTPSTSYSSSTTSLSKAQEDSSLISDTINFTDITQTSSSPKTIRNSREITSQKAPDTIESLENKNQNLEALIQQQEQKIQHAQSFQKNNKSHGNQKNITHTLTTAQNEIKKLKDQITINNKKIGELQASSTNTKTSQFQRSTNLGKLSYSKKKPNKRKKSQW